MQSFFFANSLAYINTHVAYENLHVLLLIYVTIIKNFKFNLKYDFYLCNN